jgi:hypothetical protein
MDEGAEREPADALSRREFHQRAALAGSALFLAQVDGSAKQGASDARPHVVNMSRADDALDEGLELLKNCGPEYGGGLANHGPMAAEALCAMGRGDALVPWVKRYKRNLEELPLATKKLTADEWKSALGDAARTGDWIVLMERELADGAWEDALDKWVARLSPGFVAAAAHGAIRAGHAARSLAARDTPLRRRELAHGLAYWAAQYQALPIAAQKNAQRVSVSDALSHVELMPKERRFRGGSITHGLQALSNWPPFLSVADLADTTGDPSKFLSDLTHVFARVYFEQAGAIGQRIQFVHAVTGPSALRLMLPHVKPETAHAALRYAWQTSAGIYAAFGAVTKPGSDASAPDAHDLVDLAVKNGDEHAIKFTEVCLREHALNAQPIYLVAARDACEHLAS